MAMDEALKVLENDEQIEGIGFVLGHDPETGITFGGVDLDDCRNPETGTLDDRARRLLAAFDDAYAEISPSGKGCKMFGRVPVGGKNVQLEWNAKSGAVELKSHGYFTVTGAAHGSGRSLPDLKLETVLDMLGAKTQAPGERKTSVPLAKIVPPGSQEPAIFREASRLRRLGWSTEEIAKALWVLVESGRFPNETGREPWTFQDCETKARAVEKYEAAADTFEITDPGCAEYFKATLGDSVLYDQDRRRWLLFDDVRWSADRDDEIKNRILTSLRARRRLAFEDKARLLALLRLENRIPTILTAAVPFFPSHAEDFDRDPFLLGVPNGVVDLRTGELRGASPEDRITMQTRVPYNPDAKAPLWERTVAEIFQKDPELVPYVQRALGYSVTGDCREELMFILSSALDAEQPGREGKGTIANTVREVLGDYGADLSFESLLWTRNPSGGGAASPDMAKLVHTRFVTASEANPGGVLNTARLKGMTGRDPITARHLYGNEFTFNPEFKLWLSVNHVPAVRDNAFWSRPHRIPFRTSFRAKPDLTLKDRLLLEGSGILSWLVRGALAWKASGLQAPKVVKVATEEYEESQDEMPDFLDMKCVRRADLGATFAELRMAYSFWCRDERRRAMGARAFGRALKKLFGEPGRNQARGDRMEYRGVGLQDSGARTGDVL
jgi:putative DNA primase/helicase